MSYGDVQISGKVFAMLYVLALLGVGALVWWLIMILEAMK